MKPAVLTTLCFFIGIHCGFTQDTPVIISARMFDVEQKIVLSAMSGWLFREGNDPAWANKELNTSDWKKLKPAELSTKLADKSGRVEGWFRFSFKLEKDFMNIPLFIGRGGWAATEVFIDGKFLASFGNTSADYKTYKEHNPANELSIPATLEPGKEHTIALHFIDYIAPLSFGLLRSATIGTHRSIRQGLRSLLILTGPDYNLGVQKYTREKLLYRSIWLSATILLALLFWLLFFQNLVEKKTLLLIALYSSFSALSNLTRFFLINNDVSFLIYRKNDLIFKLCTWIIFVLTFIIAKRILNFRIIPGLKPFLIAFSVLGVFSIFFNFFLKFLYLSMIVSCFFYAYILVSLWKKLKVSQWAIAIGLTLSVLFGVLFGIVNFGSYFNKHWQLFQTGIYFTFPLSLLVYVSIRFREISREKEKQALEQQRIYKELLELEARALRAQMNPHFIFNCLNSIKALMQEKQTENGITYLTVFSKLIRTLFNNADKKEITLFDEIETCKYYLQLEAMRLGTKLSYAVNVDEKIDLKSIQVPALVIQPFLENAIWHGIVPRDNVGCISLDVVKKDAMIEITIDDNGIGREVSRQNKSISDPAHQSRGVNLTQTRLELNRLLQQREADLQIIDKKDEKGKAAGTKVVLRFSEDR
jgi:sensor histidine kinase YesM